MNANFPALASDLWSLAGWTMVHFLWLGTIVAAVAFAGRLILRNAAPTTRYTFALMCLALITATPLAAAWLSRENTLASAAKEFTRRGGNLPPSTTALPNTITQNLPPTTATPFTPPIIELHTPTTASPPSSPVAPPLPALDAQRSPLAPSQPSTSLNSQPSTLNHLALAPRSSPLAAAIPYLPWLWLIGTPLTFALLFTGLIGTRRLSRASTPITTGPIADALARLTTSLRVTRRVTVAVCERVAAPVLIGIVRPMILLPPAALTGWSPDEIEMVLLHELAHIRRYDNVVNLAQRIIESLLFFHPAVWLISTWVRREREACCDAAVVARTHQPHAYAELLLNIASKLSERSDTSEPGRPRPRPFPLPRGRGRPGSLPVSSHMAAGPLRTRIRHILQLEDDPMLITPKSLAITLATLLAAATLAFVYLPKIGQAEQPTTKDTEKTDSQKNAAAQDVTQKNLKKLIMAVQNNVGNRDSLPANALYDPERRPLLSWRVYLLPFLAEEKLYSEFHLGEPWESEHNRKLIARMPAVFKNPKIDKPGFTNYLGVVGKECVFNGTPNGLRFQDITDGTSKTIAIVEANADLAVEWTKPQDWNFDRAAPTKGLGQLWGDGWYAAWVDGSIRRTDNSEPADKVGIQFTRAGGELESLKESANRVPKSAGGIMSPPGMNEGMPVAGAAGEGPIAAHAAKFPSLEDQKLADLAWKRLGLELEPIAADDLQRVKALGYDGGVKVSANDGHTIAWEDQNSIHPNDILVGLHVWPTTNLKDIATILNRDDLAELNPLKFYVVRHIAGGPAYNAAGETPPRDTVQSGRINVQLGGVSDADRARLKEAEEAARQAIDVASRTFDSAIKSKQEAQARFSEANIKGDSVEEAQRVYQQAQQQFNDAKGSFEDAQRQFKEIQRQLYFGKAGDSDADRARLEEAQHVASAAVTKAKDEAESLMPPLQEAKSKLRLAVAKGENVEAAQRAYDSAERQFGAARELWMAAQSREHEIVKAINALPRKQPAPQPLRNPPAASLDSESKNLQPAVGDFRVEQWNEEHSNHSNSQATPPLAPRSSLLAPQALRYDGKPFEEWRNVWKTELSTEKRIEAVKALAAFGRAGYGPEAAAAILDVAGEYDFMILQGGDDPEGKLKRAVLQGLIPNDRSQTLAPYWVPDLTARLQKEPKKWKWLAVNLLSQLQTDDESTLKIVRDLESSGENGVRSAALGVLVRAGRTVTGGSQLDEKTRQLIDKNLESKDPEMIRAALGYLVYSPPFSGGMAQRPKLLYQPAALPKLLFHADEQVRRRTRGLLPLLDDATATGLVDQVVAILKDPSRQRDRIDAIRAISGLGKKAAKATPALAEILKSSDDQPTLAATMVALAQIAGRAADNVVLQKVHPLVVKQYLGIELTDDESKALRAKIGGEDDERRNEFLDGVRQEQQQILSLQNANVGGGGVF